MLPTCISRRACYSLQPRVSGQKTSPCIRTRWPRILGGKKRKILLSLRNLTFSCVGLFWLLVEVFRIARSDVRCSPACISPTHSFSGSCRSCRIANTIIDGWLVKCYCLILLLCCEMHLGWPCCFFVSHFHPTKYIFISSAITLHE